MTTPLHLTDDYFQSAQITSFPNRSSQQDTADEWGWAEPISLPLLLPPPGSRTDDGGGTATHREESWPAADAVHLSGMHENEDGDLTNEEKISLLSIEFPSFTEQELQAALDGSNGKLDQAIALLNSFQEEDAGYGSRHQGSQPTQTAIENHAEFNALIDEMSAIKAEFAPSQLDQPAQFYDLGDVYETPTDEITTQLEELSMKFPSIPRESLMVALELTSFDLDAAQKILDEQTGGVSEEPLPEQLSQPISQLSTSISTNTPSKDRIHAVVAAARRQAPPKLPDHVRNQQIYDVSLCMFYINQAILSFTIYILFLLFMCFIGFFLVIYKLIFIRLTGLFIALYFAGGAFQGRASPHRLPSAGLPSSSRCRTRGQPNGHRP